MRIALDAMGGDDAPQVNIDGALEVLAERADLEVVLVGDEPLLRDLLDKRDDVPDRLHLRHAEGFVGMADKPTIALREKPNCSIAVCWKLMADREVDAVVSAGNTGGVVAAGLRTRLFLKGVKRPGIAVILPTMTGSAVLMDAGANPGARAEHLAQYATMGTVFARQILGIDSPRVGLMNIGSEDGKGTELVRETHQLILNSPAKDDYIGNVEGRGLYHGDADVIICEGFVGNVVLKVSEGMASMMLRSIGHEVLTALDTERDKAKAALHQVTKRYEYNETGGAPLLGIDGICLICHGSSDSRSIRNALKTAVTFKDREVNRRIVEKLQACETNPVG